MKTIKCFHLAVLFMAFGMVSCSETEPPNPDSEVDVETAEEVLDAERMYSDVYAVSSEALMTSELRDFDLCGSLDLDTVANTLVIDFSSGCRGPWGVTRSGKLTISYQGIPFTEGSSWSVALDNYRVNEVTLTGAVSVDNVMLENDIYSFSFRVTDGTLTVENGASYTYESNNVYRWLNGRETFIDSNDDEWEISGSSTGTNSKGQAFTASTITSLLGKQACLSDEDAYFSAGKLEIEVASLLNPMGVDFGDGSCDTEAVLSYMGFSQTISLR